MAVKHDCPYLEHNLICTHKGLDPARTKVRRKCGYKHMTACPLLRDSKSLAVEPLRALERLSDQEVEE